MYADLQEEDTRCIGEYIFCTYAETDATGSMTYCEQSTFTVYLTVNGVTPETNYTSGSLGYSGCTTSILAVYTNTYRAYGGDKVYAQNSTLIGNGSDHISTPTYTVP